MKKALLYVSLSIALISLSYYVLPSKVSAAKGLPFGGRIGFVLPCINGLLVVVLTPDPKSVGPYIITPAVIPRAFYAPFIGHAIKGSYIPGIPCYIPPFVVIPTKGAIVEFGTSLLPSII